MKAINYYLLVPSFVALCLFILEGACFRLIENYAEKRLEFAWGKPGLGNFHSLLSKLPLDHFVDPPGVEDTTDQVERAVMENQFTNSVMSFGRPLRDRLLETMEKTINPLKDYEIRDFGSVRGVVVPGLVRTATREEVNKKLARRVGDSMEFAKGLVLRVYHTNHNQGVNKEFDRLEYMFKFFLREGLACVVLPASSASELLQKVRDFKKQNPLISENIFVWGDETCGDFILEVCKEDPSVFKCILVNQPAVNLPPPRIRGMPWILVGKSADVSPEDKNLGNLFKWIVRGRDADYLYPSRLGGLLKLHDPNNLMEFDLFAVAYVLKCLDYISAVPVNWPEPKPLQDEIISAAADSSKTNFVNANDDGIDLFLMEEKIRILQENESLSLATFDCEIIRGYREIHSSDINLKMVTNRDLVLKLGMRFEEMGDDVLRRIGDKDPLFFRFYQSLKEVEDNPLN